MRNENKRSENLKLFVEGSGFDSLVGESTKNVKVAQDDQGWLNGRQSDNLGAGGQIILDAGTNKI